MKKTIAIATGAVAMIAGTLFARANVRKIDDAPVPPALDASTMRLRSTLDALAVRVRHTVPDDVETQMASRRPDTRLAIAADVDGWLAWMAKTGRGRRPRPADVLDYMREERDRGLKTATIARKVSSIGTAYGLLGMKSPTKDADVRASLVRLRSGKDIDPPVFPRTVAAMIGVCGEDVKGRRDAAMVCLAYAADLKSRELCLLEVGDLVAEDGRTMLVLPPTAVSRTGRDRVDIDAVAHDVVRTWLREGGVGDGALFRRIDLDRGAPRPRRSRKTAKDHVPTVPKQVVAHEAISRSGGTFVIGNLYDRAVAAGNVGAPPEAEAFAARIRNEPLRTVLT